MAITIDTLQKVLKDYSIVNKKVTPADFSRATKVALDAHCKTIAEVNGSYISLHSLMTNVVQGFDSNWKELGELVFKKKELKNYRLKVNFGFKPDDVEGTVLSDLYDESKPLTNQEIAKKVFEWLFIQVNDDVQDLSVNGVYDKDKANEEFGYSLNGLNAIVRNALKDSEHPVYKIPLDELTDNNMVDMLIKFERSLPIGIDRKVKKIHMSVNNVNRYKIAYYEKYGHHTTFKDADAIRSPLGKLVLVGHDGLDEGIVFATVENNIANLIKKNKVSQPKITDIQKSDYKIKVFMEFWKGYDFLINQAVFVANFTDNTKGLGNAEQMKLYYPKERI